MELVDLEIATFAFGGIAIAAVHRRVDIKAVHRRKCRAAPARLQIGIDDRCRGTG